VVCWYFLNFGSFYFYYKYFKNSSFFYAPNVVYDVNVSENFD
jgi:hypothetical protein